MKKSINKRLKVALTAALLIIIVIMSSLLFFAIRHPGTSEEKLILLNYSNKTDAKYKVFLKPNPLYDGDSLEEDKMYLNSYTDNIKANFQYEFNADKVVDIDGNYEIIVMVEGYTTEEKKVKIIWQKKFILVPKTDFKSKDTKILINKEITFLLEEYNSFATLISESSKLNMPVNATVLMNVNLNAKSGRNIIEKEFTPAITIPLNSNYFAITKSGIFDQPEVIEETKEIVLPVNQNVVIAYGAVLGIAFLALLYLLIFVKGNAPVDVFKKHLNKIFKFHGTRLVAINNEIGTSFGMYYKVKSIEDLVRIADELGKPIMYRFSTNSKEITKFYIHDDKAMYSFNLKDMLAEKDVEEVVVESINVDNNKEIPLE